MIRSLAGVTIGFLVIFSASKYFSFCLSIITRTLLFSILVTSMIVSCCSSSIVNMKFATHCLLFASIGCAFYRCDWIVLFLICLRGIEVSFLVYSFRLISLRSFSLLGCSLVSSFGDRFLSFRVIILSFSTRI